MRHFAVFIAILAGLILGGCSFSLQKETPPNEVWRLKVPSMAELHAVDRSTPLPVNIQLEKPRLSASHNSDRIVIEQARGEVDVIAGHQWNNQFANSLHDYWLEYFQTSRRFGSVQSQKTGQLPNIALTLYVWDFSTYGDAASNELPQVRLKLQAYINSPKTAPQSFDFEKSIPISSDVGLQRGRVAAIVAAHELLLEEASARILEQLINVALVYNR